MNRREWLAAAAAWGVTPAMAQRFAQRPVRMVVPFPPGGAIDAMARPIAQSLGTELGQAVVVENRPGSGGSIGAAQVARAPADGHTLLVATSATHGANPSLFAKLPYDPLADFEFVSLWGSVPNVLVVPTASALRSVKDLVDRARREPGKLTYSSAGVGTSLHLSGVLFERVAGVKLLHVPYKGGAPAMLDLLGGNVDMQFDTVSVSLPNLKAGKLRALAVAATERHFALPDVPTFAELGLRGVEAATWAGTVVAKGTPTAALEELRAAHAKVLAERSVQDTLRGNGVQMLARSGDAFRQYATAEIRRWADVVKDAGITPE